MNVFVNTWSVEGFVSEGLQPAELGWGTHEKWMPANGRRHKTGCGAAIYLLQPGANTRVRSWTPTAQAQYGFLVTHNESISIADYFTLREGGKADLPADLPLRLSSLQRRGAVAARDVRPRWQRQPEDVHILDEHEIVDGIDELGVLLYGHKKNAYWYGSQLSIEETRELAPYQNATGLQVTSAVLAGMVWALENPKARHRRGRRDGFPPLPRGADALSRAGDRQLHRLDAAHRPAGPVPGGHRQARSVAVQERAEPLNACRLNNRATGGQ